MPWLRERARGVADRQDFSRTGVIKVSWEQKRRPAGTLWHQGAAAAKFELPCRDGFLQFAMSQRTSLILRFDCGSARASQSHQITSESMVRPCALLIKPPVLGQVPGSASQLNGHQEDAHHLL